MRAVQRWIETAFETFLFNSRLIVILAVVGSLTSSVLMFVRGVVVIWHTAKEFLHHFGDAHGQGEELSISLISSVDSFLFATVLLIFAMGIYELFISKIDPASRTEESRPNWLQIHSLDDLKSAVGKVILMILIVRLFESAVKMKYETPLHLLYLGLSVLFVAGALFLQHASHKNDKKHEEDHSRKHKPAEHKALEHTSEAPVPALATPSAAPAFVAQPPHPSFAPPPPFTGGHQPMLHPMHAEPQYSQQPQQPYPTMAPAVMAPPVSQNGASNQNGWGQPAQPMQQAPLGHHDPYAAPRSY
jgi:uncharacterized membrane protein YqhA